MATKRISLQYQGYLVDAYRKDLDRSDYAEYLLIDNTMFQNITTEEDFLRIYNAIGGVSAWDTMENLGQVTNFPEILEKAVPPCFMEKLEENESGFGGTRIHIPDFNIRIYWGDEMRTLEEAQRLFDEKLECGACVLEGHDVGFSEVTITDFIYETMTIGGHNLNAELKDKIGKYVHILIDFPV